jgi:L-malate glycosyltransferase
MKNRKILHVIDYVGIGGAQSLLRDFFELQKFNENIFIYPLRKKYSNDKIIHRNYIDTKSHSKYSLSPFWDIYKIIKDNNIEILHCHLFRSQVFGWIIKTVFFDKKIKIVFHEHGQVLQNDFYYKLLMRVLKVDLWIAVSEACLQNIKNKLYIPEKKIIKLFNFIDIKKFIFPIKKSKLLSEKKEIIIGFVGRLEEVKGANLLVNIVKVLPKNITIFIVGTGSLEMKIKEKIKKEKLEKRFYFLGYCNDMKEIYSKLDILLIPSLSESFGLVALEAQACKVPVVASNIQGLNEVLKHKINSLLFRVQDIDSIKENILEIISNDRLREEIVEEGFKSVKEYSFESFLIKLSKIYDKL